MSYDFIKPSHYKGGIETIEKMRRIWGNEAAALWCEMTAFKYRERIGKKPGEPVERELDKIEWYERKAEDLRQSNRRNWTDYGQQESPSLQSLQDREGHN